MGWFDAKTNPPVRNGNYLCVVAYSGFAGRYHRILNYTKNLEKVDKYDFQGEKRPGWFYYDSEYGHIEVENVTYWMPLPALPNT